MSLSTHVTQLIEATTEVFETMVFRQLYTGTPIEGEALRPQSNVVVSVSFAGPQCGTVVFYATLDTARSITAAMLGMPTAQVNGEVPDAIGEITNMIAGSFRTRMADRTGGAWALSIPTVIMGSDFYTKYVSDVRRVLCPFQMDDGEIFVELIVRKS